MVSDRPGRLRPIFGPIATIVRCLFALPRPGATLLGLQGGVPARLAVCCSMSQLILVLSMSQLISVFPMSSALSFDTGHLALNEGCPSLETGSPEPRKPRTPSITNTHLVRDPVLARSLPTLCLAASLSQDLCSFIPRRLHGGGGHGP